MERNGNVTVFMPPTVYWINIWINLMSAKCLTRGFCKNRYVTKLWRLLHCEAQFQRPSWQATPLNYLGLCTWLCGQGIAQSAVSKADCQPRSQCVSCAGAREPETECATSVRVPQTVSTRQSSCLANCTPLHASVHCCLSVQEAKVVPIAS